MFNRFTYIPYTFLHSFNYIKINYFHTHFITFLATYSLAMSIHNMSKKLQQFSKPTTWGIKTAPWLQKQETSQIKVTLKTPQLPCSNSVHSP